MKCDKHPRYQGKQQPRRYCRKCWEIWKNNQPRKVVEKPYSTYGGGISTTPVHFYLEGNVEDVIKILQGTFKAVEELGGKNPSLRTYYDYCDNSSYLYLAYEIEEAEEERLERVNKVEEDFFRSYEWRRNQYETLRKEFED
jgi:hypothetical protein